MMNFSEFFCSAANSMCFCVCGGVGVQAFAEHQGGIFSGRV